MPLTYVKPEKVDLRRDPTLGEKWVQAHIAEDPGILGLGDLIVRDQERMQPGAGRLDLLLQDPDTNLRYEVEIQLGRTDESHIIRTIEYWDIERKRFPQYDHVAVIVAEDITSRFLNVISLFNGVIPLIAIQMNALRFGEMVTLVCTTVLDQRVLGITDEEEQDQEVTDRAYWEKRGTPATVAMVDAIMSDIVSTVGEGFELKYNKFYIGIYRDGQPCNFVTFRAQKQALRIEPRLERSEAIQARLEEAGLDVMDYSVRNRRYRIRLTKGDTRKHEELLRDRVVSKSTVTAGG
jgi:hypothetical protein